MSFMSSSKKEILCAPFGDFQRQTLSAIVLHKQASHASMDRPADGDSARL
jgi:hypothetical protein